MFVALLCTASSNLVLNFTEAKAGGSPSFKSLLGTWGGGGILKLNDGSSARIQCNGYYTGGGTQLGMVIRCTNKDQKIEMRSKLSLNSNQISGKWEERTYNAEGQIFGKISKTRISMKISGSIEGSMNVRYSRTSQTVTIKTNNASLRSIKINLKRR